MKIILFLILILFSGLLPAYGDPLLKDQDLVIEKFVSGLSLPTTMSFVGDDLLVLEKNTGKVRLV
ncbi:MAG TPA: hypothetical protein VLB45_07210, partial [Nitrosopumilaceae archaeon]|nr:hypothetical protein [Nitrosopumilaceae archaeon]